MAYWGDAFQHSAKSLQSWMLTGSSGLPRVRTHGCSQSARSPPGACLYSHLLFPGSQLAAQAEFNPTGGLRKRRSA